MMSRFNKFNVFTCIWGDFVSFCSTWTLTLFCRNKADHFIYCILFTTFSVFLVTFWSQDSQERLTLLGFSVFVDTQEPALKENTCAIYYWAELKWVVWLAGPTALLLKTYDGEKERFMGQSCSRTCWSSFLMQRRSVFVDSACLCGF